MKKYLETYNLVTHSDKRNKESFFHVTLMATFLLKCLKVANYFGETHQQTSKLNFSGDDCLLFGKTPFEAAC